MEILNFIIKDILGQASILIALISFVGLIIQRKGVGQSIAGAFKTLMGFLVMIAGIELIVSTLTIFGKIFEKAFGLKGYISDVGAIAGMANSQLGGETALILLTIFLVNILIARLTKFKYIFLTGQALLWQSTIGAVIGYTAGLRGVTLILTAGVIGGIFAVLMPAIAQPTVRKITDSDDIALGHFCTIGYIFQAFVAKVMTKAFGKSNSIEDIEFPEAFAFLQDTYLSMGVVMLPMYLLPTIIAGKDFVSTLSGGQNYIVFMTLQSVTFVVGVYVMMSGVRLLLAEIVPAFRGIALRVVPDAVPALDCPVLFPYGPNAVIGGFIFTLIGCIIGMLLLPKFGLAMILPGILTCFFAGGTAGIFGDALGGRRGVIVGGIAHGLFITWLPAMLVPFIEAMGFTGVTFSDSDVIVNGLLLGKALNNSWIFVISFIVFVALITKYVNGRSKSVNIEEQEAKTRHV